MSKPLVAVVGRPNVGKSTFFNRIAGRKISIVENIPGVTRDRVYADAEWNGYAFSLVDTGGLELKSTDEMYIHIREQAEIAIETADTIVFFTDGKSGMTSADEDVAQMLRRSKKPVVLAVNKLDNYSVVALAEFYSLGLGDPVGISCEHGQGIGDLLDRITETFAGREKEELDGERIKIAVVGKPNAGKSSLVNKILGYDRTIVSSIAGTTRDAIDTPFTFDNVDYTLIDTAGIRKKRSVDTDVEYYSVIRALGAIRRADVCIIVIDASENISEQDLKIAGYVHEQGKPSVVVMNKWDLIEKDTNTINKFEANLSEELKFMSYFKSVYVSAKSGQRVDKIMQMVQYAYSKSMFRVTTGLLNDMMSDAVKVTEPPTKNGKRLKFYFASQVTVAPPTFVFKVNDVELVHFSYQRYLENYLRKTFSIDATPIKLIFRNRKDEA